VERLTEKAIMSSKQIPTVTKPTVTKPPRHRCPLRPAAVIGDIAAVPRIAVINVFGRRLIEC
jgi:hypothetical protein